MKIQDKILDPYYIVIDSYNHTLHKKSIIEKTNEETSFVVGYFSTIIGALKRIREDKIKASEKTLTIEQYINRVGQINKQFLDEFDNKDISEFVIEKIVYKTKIKKQ